MKKRIGKDNKYESLVDVVSPKPTNDVKEFVEQARGVSPSGIYSDIERLEERARKVLDNSGENLERYHELSSQKKCAERTLLYTDILKKALSNQDTELAVFAALRASEQANLILIHHWETPARVGQNQIEKNNRPKYTENQKNAWIEMARRFFDDPSNKRKSQRALSELVGMELGIPDETIRLHLKEQQIPICWKRG